MPTGVQPEAYRIRLGVWSPPLGVSAPDTIARCVRDSIAGYHNAVILHSFGAASAELLAPDHDFSIRSQYRFQIAIPKRASTGSVAGGCRLPLRNCVATTVEPWRAANCTPDKSPV